AVVTNRVGTLTPRRSAVLGVLSPSTPPTRPVVNGIVVIIIIVVISARAATSRAFVFGWFDRRNVFHTSSRSGGHRRGSRTRWPFLKNLDIGIPFVVGCIRRNRHKPLTARAFRSLSGCTFGGTYSFAAMGAGEPNHRCASPLLALISGYHVGE